jgi:tRNA threonylcarbamoyladenosine biosynthesis protein TsaB
MKILALELSTARGSVAFREADELRFVRQFPADRKDSALFYENLSALRKECGLPDLITVGLGPGSYAGIRIAIATAIGLGAAATAPVVGLPSICAIERAEYRIIGDARRCSYFFAHVADGKSIEGLLLMNEEELRAKLDERPDAPILSAQPLTQFENVVLTYPSASVLAKLGAQAQPNDAPLEPIYLRPPYITQPKPWTR